MSIVICKILHTIFNRSAYMKNSPVLLKIRSKTGEYDNSLIS